MASHPLDPTALAVVAFAVFLITFMKGMFGGGFAIVGIPFMALVMDPIAAGALLAPVLCLSDIVALRYWRPSTWSKPDLILLMPGQLLGIGTGYLFMRIADLSMLKIRCDLGIRLSATIASDDCISATSEFAMAAMRPAWR